jgi:hypothetical protein
MFYLKIVCIILSIIEFILIKKIQNKKFNF